MEIAVRFFAQLAYLAVAAQFFFSLPLYAAQSATPRAGGELVFAVGGTPPSYDGHRETTFAMLHPIAPHYSTLLRFDPQNYPKIVGDVAESWTISRDGLTYTFKIRRGIKFHDASELTSKDVKATLRQDHFSARRSREREASFLRIGEECGSAGSLHCRLPAQASIRVFSG